MKLIGWKKFKVIHQKVGYTKEITTTKFYLFFIPIYSVTTTVNYPKYKE